MFLSFVFGESLNISVNYLRIASVISMGFLIMIMGITNTIEWCELRKDYFNFRCCNFINRD